MGHTNKYIAIRTMGLYFFQYIVIHGIFKKKSFYAYFIKENWDLCGIQCICEVVVHHFNDKYQEMQLELCFLWKKIRSLWETWSSIKKLQTTLS